MASIVNGSFFITALKLTFFKICFYEKADCSDMPERLDLPSGKEQSFCLAVTEGGKKTKAWKVRALPWFGFDRS